MNDPNWMLGIGVPPPLDLAALEPGPPPTEVTHRFEVALEDRHLRALRWWPGSWLSWLAPAAFNVAVLRVLDGAR